MTEVVAALIWDEKHEKFLICQRPSHKSCGLLWEFVGGKVESGETHEAALIRECREELAVTLTVGSVFTEVMHQYPDITVHLTLFHAAIVEGTPQMLEHNDIRWITPAEIPQYEFCPADKEILEKIVMQCNCEEHSMEKVILICGKTCCGKTTYAKELCRQSKTVLLSIDEITLALFGQHCGEKHDEYVERTEKYLFQKSLELIRAGNTVVLDWGFWQKAERDYASTFYTSRGIECALHYLDISDDLWSERLKKRNAMVEADPTIAYYVDENLAMKFASLFESPQSEEIDIWIKSE